MSRYIDADKVKGYILSTGFYCDTEADRKYSAELIDELFPTADVAEVRHGRWEWEGFNIECSACGCMPQFDSTEPLYNYCPNCGSCMDLEGEEE